jgi:rfaE bifunctional protein kinase chain/domain
VAIKMDTQIDAIMSGIRPGGRVCFVSGKFNVLHPGHLRHLKFAAENGDALVVGLLPDATPGVSVPAELRMEALMSIAIVYHVVLLEEPPEQFIARLKPAVVVKGKEYEGLDNPEAAVVQGYGGQLLFSSGEVRFSSVELLRREYYERDFSTISKPLDFPRRRDFDIAGLKAELGRIAGIRALVIGDLIIDTYIECEPLGMSQEDPTIVVTPIEQKTFVGGAGIVAAHARGLGAEVEFVSITGTDLDADFARKRLGEFRVETSLFPDSTRPTTHKQRYRALGKTLLRVNHLRQHAISSEVAARVLNRIDDLLPRTDLLVFSDFNYGCLPQSLVDQITERARARGVMMAADSQASSQISDISRFRGMTLVTPTEREARLALADYESGLINVAEKLRQRAQAQNIVVTMGAEGILIYADEAGKLQADQLPAFNSAPKDVAGAGDSLLISTSLALCAGLDIWRSSYIGCIAAACQISRVGNTPLALDDLMVELEQPS